MFESIKVWPSKAKKGVDYFLEERCNFSQKQRHLTWHMLKLFWEQILAVIPISLLQIFVLGVFFQMTIIDAGLQVMGMFLAIIGLTLFLDGLRIGVMPLAEYMGQELPKKLHLVFVLLIAGLLGILVTYAEPAIASLRPLASIVDPVRAPYLYFILNVQQELMVFAIGAGVGVASIIGVLRFIKDWPLKPIMFMSLIPTVAMACYMMWGNPDLAPIIGLAWDCGGVTTGPVTVPSLLAVSLGVMNNRRQRRLAQAALEGAVAADAGQSLQGFGIVTLASLWPILAVQLMGIIDGAIYSREYVLEKALEAASQPPSSSPTEISPVKEVIYGIRAIMPLFAFLMIVILVILRVPLPKCSVWVDPPADEDDPSVRDGSLHSVDSIKPPSDALSRTSMAIAKYEKTLHRTDSASTIASDIEGGGGDSQHSAIDAKQELDAATVSVPEKKVGCFSAVGNWFRDNAPLLVGIAMTQLGIIAFNEGLTYSFAKLGDQTGRTLPAAFLSVAGFPKSPYYGYAGGLILVLVVIFLLGFLCTRSEPALVVLGRTVERLSGRAFTAKLLIYAVAIGVGVGMGVGAVEILYSIPIIYFILGKYAVASALTFISEESITAVAWDSAGVTTGPISVPYVLSIGIGLSVAVNSPQGFGMLTIASVAPIISVLLTAKLRKPAKKARRQLSTAARKLGRTMTNNRALRSMKRSPSTAMAAFIMDAGGSVAPTPEPSAHDGNQFDPNNNNNNGAEQA